MDVLFALNAAEKSIKAQILGSSTDFKRNKLCEQNDQYVEPLTKMIGTRWVQQKLQNTPTKYMHRVPSTIQYIPIRQTIQKTIFERRFLQ